MGELLKRSLQYIFLIGSTVIITLIIFSRYAPTTRGSYFYAPDIKDNSPVPQMYTCDGENISPELSWKFPGQQNIQSYVLIVDDPDAQKVVGKTFVHWVVLMPGNINHLPKAISGKLGSSGTYENTREIINDSKKAIYYGPCPPADSGTHTYRFTLFATNVPVQDMSSHLLEPLNAEAFSSAMQSSIISWMRFTGTYAKRG